MKRNKYKGISFCESWQEPNKTFEQFKTAFENVWIFATLEPKERLSELKKAFKVATKKATDIKVNEAQEVSEEKEE